MKTILVVLAVMLAAGCYTQKELQAEIIRAELIKIDTIQRYNLNIIQKQQQLTWRDSYNIEYVTFAPLHENYLVGTRMVVLKPR